MIPWPGPTTNMNERTENRKQSPSRVCVPLSTFVVQLDETTQALSKRRRMSQGKLYGTKFGRGMLSRAKSGRDHRLFDKEGVKHVRMISPQKSYVRFGFELLLDSRNNRPREVNLNP
jgi:hypothetical protein